MNTGAGPAGWLACRIGDRESLAEDLRRG